MFRIAAALLCFLFSFACKGIGQESIFLGIDSLTDGAGGSTYREYFHADHVSEEIGYIPINYESINYVDISVYMTEGMSWIHPSIGYDKYPKKFSLDGKGAFTNNGNGEKAVFNLSKLRNFDRIGLFYLKQPNGGSFSVSLGNGNEIRNKIPINTKSNMFDIGYVEIENNLFRRFYVDDINGKVVFFGLNFIDLDTNKIAVNTLAKGGVKLREIASLDSKFRKKWFSILKPSYYILNAGMNDRKLVKASQFQTDLYTFLNDLKKGAPECKVILVEPNEPADYESTFLPKYRKLRKEVALTSENIFYFSIPEHIGNYEFFKKNKMMLDLVHPNEKGNQIIGKELYKYYLSIR